MMNLALFPTAFDALVIAPPEGMTISERVIEPIAILSRSSGTLSVTLGRLGTHGSQMAVF